MLKKILEITRMINQIITDFAGIQRKRWNRLQEQSRGRLASGRWRRHFPTGILPFAAYVDERLGTGVQAISRHKVVRCGISRNNVYTSAPERMAVRRGCRNRHRRYDRKKCGIYIKYTQTRHPEKLVICHLYSWLWRVQSLVLAASFISEFRFVAPDKTKVCFNIGCPINFISLFLSILCALLRNNLQFIRRKTMKITGLSALISGLAFSIDLSTAQEVW